MKSILPIAVIAVFSVFLPVADAARIMPLGDSITRGWYGSVNHWGYRKPLYDNLTSAGYSFDFVGSAADGSFPDPNHEGHDGWLADQILTYVQSWLNTRQPDVVLLHIGTNDIAQGNQDANEVNGILNVIDNYEVVNNRHITVILALIINRSDSVPLSQATTAFNDDVNAMAMNRIAAGDDIIVVNMEDALNYPSDLYDGVHPNNTGYAKMASVWYNGLVIYFSKKTLSVTSSQGGNVMTPGEGAFRCDQGAIVNLTAQTDANFYFVNWTGTAVDAGKVDKPNEEITAVVVDNDYTLAANFAPKGINALDEVNNRLELTADGNIAEFTAFYNANGWQLDTAEDFTVKVDFHYSDVSDANGWMGMTVGDDVNFVSILVGSNGGASYFYYEAAVVGNVVTEQETRAAYNGTLYVTYDSAAKKFCLSHTGFGSGNAYVWAAFDPTQGQWSLPVGISLGGGSTGAPIGPGEAYLDNFQVEQAKLIGWPPVTDIDKNGFIELEDLAEMCSNWLEAGLGDIDNNEIVDFYDFAIFGPAW